MTDNHILFDGLRKSLSDLKQHFEDFCQEEISNIISVGKRLHPTFNHLNNLILCYFALHI